MISLAKRRHRGLAWRPALFAFALPMALALLAGCRPAAGEPPLEGTVLGTGYHITLNDDLTPAARRRLEAVIQGELDAMQHAHDRQARPFRAARPPLGPAANRRLLQALARHYRVRALDRLVERLGQAGVRHALVELGGMQHGLGRANRRPWRVSLGRPGLEAGRHDILRLEDLTLVTRQAPDTVDAADQARILAVSAVAPSAVEADRLARELLAGDPPQAVERAIRLVVLRPRGIDIRYGAALLPLLER